VRSGKQLTIVVAWAGSLDRGSASCAVALDWRGKPLDPAFLATAEEQREHPVCRLCRLLSADGF
jgi:hypothetical protein